jgi:thioredoxin reductase
MKTTDEDRLQTNFQASEKMAVYDVAIVGGSFSGMAAALSLLRAGRSVLVLDDERPCNRNADRSYNVPGMDGIPLASFRATIKSNLHNYPTFRFQFTTVQQIEPLERIFRISDNVSSWKARKIILCTGLLDTLPAINQLDQCWGKSVVHCPYCHAYEQEGKALGVIGHDEKAYQLANLVRSWSHTVSLFTNAGPSLSEQHLYVLEQRGIPVVTKSIDSLQHTNGVLEAIRFYDQSEIRVSFLFVNTINTQSNTFRDQLKYELTGNGRIAVDACYRSSVPGLYAAGDCVSSFRSVAEAIATGTKAGTFVHQDLVIDEISQIKAGFSAG